MKMPCAVCELFLGMIGFAQVLSFPGSQQTEGPQERREPVAVVELFTSEGCSSCPPAEKYLNDLVAQARDNKKKIFPLAFHVDYWNHLGWKDEFSDARFSQRQREYADSRITDGIYTPQMIVNGETAFVGSNRQQGGWAIAKALQQPAELGIALQANYDTAAAKIKIAFEIAPAQPGSVLQVALVERGIRREIRGGENKGLFLVHENVVRAFKTVSLKKSASGQADLAAPAGLARGNAAVIAYVQDRETHRILGAASVDW
jgi:hypothetical protein